MKIAEEEAHRVLKYVVVVSRQGYSLSREEVEAFAGNPQRRMIGGLQSRVLTATLVSALAGSIEPVVDWMMRLGWVTEDYRGLQSTDLGQAVLRDLEQEKIEATGHIEVMIEPQNPISYAEVIQRIAQHKDAMLVDPYFKLDQIMDIVNYTSVSRVLTSEKIGKAAVAGLAKAMAQIVVERSFEIRVGKKDLHDRCIVPPDGNVDFIGTSLSGVGKGISVMGSLGPEASMRIRHLYGEIWNEADHLPMQGGVDPQRQVDDRGSLQRFEQLRVPSLPRGTAGRPKPMSRYVRRCRGRDMSPG